MDLKKRKGKENLIFFRIALLLNLNIIISRKDNCLMSALFIFPICFLHFFTTFFFKIFLFPIAVLLNRPFLPFHPILPIHPIRIVSVILPLYMEFLVLTIFLLYSIFPRIMISAIFILFLRPSDIVYQMDRTAHFICKTK